MSLPSLSRQLRKNLASRSSQLLNSAWLAPPGSTLRTALSPSAESISTSQADPAPFGSLMPGHCEVIGLTTCQLTVRMPSRS